MPVRRLDVINELGLHARAAAKIVSTAQRYESNITLSYGDITIDATSIMGILMLGATCGVTVTVETLGADENDALQALVDLFSDRFGEES